MKEFNKWAEKYLIENEKYPSTREIWKAALEWALSLTLVNDYVSESFIPKDKVKKELED